MIARGRVCQLRVRRSRQNPPLVLHSKLFDYNTMLYTHTKTKNVADTLDKFKHRVIGFTAIVKWLFKVTLLKLIRVLFNTTCLWHCFFIWRTVSKVCNKLIRVLDLPTNLALSRSAQCYIVHTLIYWYNSLVSINSTTVVSVKLTRNWSIVELRTHSIISKCTSKSFEIEYKKRMQLAVIFLQ